MPATGLTTYPMTVQDQLAGVVELASALLGQNLAGLYLTGDAFTGPSAADTATLRLLVVTVRDLLRDTRLGLVQTCLRHSLQPAALEVLVVRATDLAVAHPAVLVQVHFTEAQRQQLALETAGHTWLGWPEGPAGAVDRASLLDRHRRGTIPLLGPPLPALLTPAATTATGEGGLPVTPTGGTSQAPPGQQLPFFAEGRP